jgi:hypothetical protein
MVSTWLFNGRNVVVPRYGIRALSPVFTGLLSNACTRPNQGRPLLLDASEGPGET